MKTVLFGAMAILFLSGCYDNERKDFIKKYGALSAYECDQSGFLVRIYFFGGNTHKELVTNDAGVPTRCSNNITVNVKETVATGALSGSVQ